MSVTPGYSKIVTRMPRLLVIQDAGAGTASAKGCVIFGFTPLTMFGVFLLAKYGADPASQAAAIPWGIGLIVICPLLAVLMLRTKTHVGMRISPDGIVSVKASATQEFPNRIPRENIKFLHIQPVRPDLFLLAASPQVGRPLASLPPQEACELAREVGVMLQLPCHLTATGTLSMTSIKDVAMAAFTHNKQALSAALPSVLFFDLTRGVLFGSIHGAAPIAPGSTLKLEELNEHPISDLKEIIIFCDKNGVQAERRDSDGDPYTVFEYSFHLEFHIEGLPPIAIGNYFSAEGRLTANSQALHDAGWMANFYRTNLMSLTPPANGYPF